MKKKYLPLNIQMIGCLLGSIVSSVGMSLLYGNESANKIFGLPAMVEMQIFLLGAAFLLQQPMMRHWYDMLTIFPIKKTQIIHRISWYAESLIWLKGICSMIIFLLTGVFRYILVEAVVTMGWLCALNIFLMLMGKNINYSLDNLPSAILMIFMLFLGAPQTAYYMLIETHSGNELMIFSVVALVVLAVVYVIVHKANIKNMHKQFYQS